MKNPPSWLDYKWILQRGGRDALGQRRWYRQYCEEPLRDGAEDDIWASLVNGVCLGTQEFWERISSQQPESAEEDAPLTFNQIRRALEKVRGQQWEDFAQRHGDPGRDLLLYLMRERSGESMGAIAAACGMRRAGTVVLAIRRFEARLKSDKAWRKLLNQTIQTAELNDL